MLKQKDQGIHVAESKDGEVKGCEASGSRVPGTQLRTDDRGLSRISVNSGKQEEGQLSCGPDHKIEAEIPVVNSMQLGAAQVPINAETNCREESEEGKEARVAEPSKRSKEAHVAGPPKERGKESHVAGAQGKASEESQVAEFQESTGRSADVAKGKAHKKAVLKKSFKYILQRAGVKSKIDVKFTDGNKQTRAISKRETHEGPSGKSGTRTDDNDHQSNRCKNDKVDTVAPGESDLENDLIAAFWSELQGRSNSKNSKNGQNNQDRTGEAKAANQDADDGETHSMRKNGTASQEEGTNGYQLWSSSLLNRSSLLRAPRITHRSWRGCRIQSANVYRCGGHAPSRLGFGPSRGSGGSGRSHQLEQ